MTDLVTGWLLLWLESGIRWIPVLAATLVVARLVRRRGAAAVHAAWLCALLAVAALAALHQVLPAQRFAIEVAWQPRPQASSPASTAAGEVATGSVEDIVEREAGSETPSIRGVARAAAVRRPTELSWTSAAAWAWALIAAALLLRELAAAAHARRLIRSSDEITGELRRRGLHACAARVPVRSAHVEVPVVCGMLRPAILLPSQWHEWPSEWLRAALLHEAAHVRRRDILTQSCARLLCAVLWFHPGAWLTRRRLETEAENATDEAVLHAGMDRFRYGEALLALARWCGTRERPVAGIAVAARGPLGERLLRILHAQPATASWRAVSAAAVAIALLTVAAAVPVARAQPLSWLTRTAAADGSVLWRSACAGGATACERFAGAAVAALSERQASGIVALLSVHTGAVVHYVHYDASGSSHPVPALPAAGLALLPLAAAWWELGMGDRPQPCPAVINLAGAGSYPNGNGLDTGIVRAPHDVVTMQCSTGAIAMGWYLDDEHGSERIAQAFARFGFAPGDNAETRTRGLDPAPQEPNVATLIDVRTTWRLAGSEHGSVRTSPLDIARFLLAIANDGRAYAVIPPGAAIGTSGTQLFAAGTAARLRHTLSAASAHTKSRPDVRELIGLSVHSSTDDDAIVSAFAGLALDARRRPEHAIVVWLASPPAHPDGPAARALAERLLRLHD